MKLASIELLSGLDAHPNADTLDLAHVLGWQCVVKRGQFQVGQRVVFVPIDTILPDDASWAAFLKKDGRAIRVKTIKLRGQVSRGLVFSTDILPSEYRDAAVGVDVGAALGIRKFEKEVPMEAGEMLGAFPLWLVSKTDEDNGLSYPDVVAEVLRHRLTVTQKLDGSSCTVVVDGGVISKVCSRNVDLKESDSSIFWRAARKLKIPAGMCCVIQGELMGPGIQGNQLGLADPALYVYQIRVNGVLSGSPTWLTYPAMVEVCSEMQCESVTRIAHNVILDMVSLEEMAAKVQLPSGEPSEGIVIRPVDYRQSGTGRPLGFKLINPNYKEE